MSRGVHTQDERRIRVKESVRRKEKNAGEMCTGEGEGVKVKGGAVYLSFDQRSDARSWMLWSRRAGLRYGFVASLANSMSTVMRSSCCIATVGGVYVKNAAFLSFVCALMILSRNRLTM